MPRALGRAVLILLLAAAFALYAAPLGAEITDADVAQLSEHNPAQNLELLEPPSLGGLLGRLLLALAAVCVLIYAMTWLARKYLPSRLVGGRGGAIEILSTRPLGARKNLLLVRVRDKTILLGSTAHSLHFLTDVEEGEGAWDEAAVQAGLGSLPGAGREEAR